MIASLKLEGATEWANDLLEAAKDNPEVLAEIVTDLGLFLEANAKAACPVDYGRLRASIGHWTPSDLNPHDAGYLKEAVDASDADAHFQVKSISGGIRVEIGTNVRYAEYVEFGTSKMTGRHYMEKAVQATQQYMPHAIIEKLTNHGLY